MIKYFPISHLFPFGEKLKMKAKRLETALKSVCLLLAAVV